MVMDATIQIPQQTPNDAGLPRNYSQRPMSQMRRFEEWTHHLLSTGIVMGIQ
ncbi:MAG: hypothetical protein AAGA75_08970 [Cyanobacteria bacterium P01_E01_bin.6]